MLAASSDAAGQQSHVSSRGPRFFLAGWSGGHELDASAAPVLRRRVSLDLSDVTIGEALKEVTRQADLEISYSPRMVPLNRPVSVHAQGITVAAALTEILLDVAVDVSITAGGGLALVPRSRTASVLADTGTVAGQVSDSGTGLPIAGATVSIDGRRGSTVTDAGGRYRIGGLPVGTYTVRARYIGYRPASVSVTITAEGEATANVILRKAAQQLEQVVVTGTIVPTEVRALPTPVTVINDTDIALQRAPNLQEVFRQGVPTAVGWAMPNAPTTTAFSVRGANTLGPGGGQMKVFVDGIEAASASTAPIDPSSIERIEVIRGPQAGAIYGSDATGGVIQVFTKRGDPSLTRPRVDAQSAFGLMQTPYAGFGGVLRQNYSASIHGGGSDLGYNFGAAYSHSDDYLPNGEQSRQSTPSVYGGMRFARGNVTIDVSGRHLLINAPQVINPELAQTGFAFYSKPFHQPYQNQNQTVGARFSVTPTNWWLHTVAVGLDRFTQEVAQTQPRLTTPADTLLTFFSLARTKTSIAYNTSVYGALSSRITGSLTAGVDHYSFPVTQAFTGGALNTSGTIRTVPSQPVSTTRSVTNNTGYFGQMQIGLWNALFLTGGIRAERNTQFGDSLGTPVSPRFGLSYANGNGWGIWKLRGSYGRSIRPPSPGQAFAVETPASVVLANPALGPERQRGWDAGFDAVLGRRLSLSATYYNQIADDLIQLVLLQSTPAPTSQNQNVGRVKNSGVEIEGVLDAGPVRLKTQYGFARSRIQALAPNYTGDLRVGDQSLLTPKHTAGASLALTPWNGSSLGAGLTYVGSWSYYDWLALFRCFGGTGPCRPTMRDYITSYPSFVKVNATLWQQITPLVSGFVSVDNLTNNEAFEFHNFSPVVGRVTTVGLRLQY